MPRRYRTFRVRNSLDQRLIQAARRNHRTVSEEIEARLERAFLLQPCTPARSTEQDQPKNEEAAPDR